MMSLHSLALADSATPMKIHAMPMNCVKELDHACAVGSPQAYRSVSFEHRFFPGDKSLVGASKVFSLHADCLSLSLDLKSLLDTDVPLLMQAFFLYLPLFL